jgi:hypothetical protein
MKYYAKLNDGGSAMQVEVGKVYKCGDDYVYIDYHSEWLESVMNCFSFIGIHCDITGHPIKPVVGKFDEIGDYALTNPQELRHVLQEIPKRETVTFYGKTYYRDEYEKAEAAFQKALAGLSEVVGEEKL